jgi:hypothetical protein
VKLLPNHRAHGAQHLIWRWRVLARKAGCKARASCEVNRVPMIASELHQRGCPLTFETPSEFDLDSRVRAQVKFIELAMEVLCVP